MFIYHITTRDAWESAGQSGQYSAPSLAEEGFIHASTLAQVVDTATRYYSGQFGLVLLVIDVDEIQPRVQFDPVIRCGEEQKYPHIYGPLNRSAVVEVVDFPPGEGGTFSLPPALTTGASR